MKKLIALALALVMAFALCACGQQAAPAAEAPAAAETETQIEASTEAPAVDLSNLNVTCVVPYDAGGGTDAVMRGLADAAKGSFNYKLAHLDEFRVCRITIEYI